MKRIDLSEREEIEFSENGILTKTIRVLPDWMAEGSKVRLGHWDAEVASISPKGSETNPTFIVGFVMKF